MKRIFDRRRIGREGEELAASYLKKKGYSVTAKNFTVRGGEIDVIAENETFLVFVEVKLRQKKHTPFFGPPSRAVDGEKKRHLMHAARVFLGRYPTEKLIRFDVIEIEVGEGENPEKEITHLEDVFQPL